MVVNLLILLSYLPLRTLYAISRVLSLMLNYGLKYRKKVIYGNLKNSFPDRTESEIKEIASEYYTYLSEITVETIKLYSMSDNELNNRITFENPEILAQYQTNDKSVIIMMGHSGNWEWAGAATAVKFRFKTIPIYRKLKDTSMNRYFKFMRSKHGGQPVLDSDISGVLAGNISNVALAMLADQTPRGRKGWWLNFMNQITPFFRGSEILATRNTDMGVVFAHVNRTSRGFYSIHLEDAPADWRATPYKLTKSFARFLEFRINQDPENWLWSHRRWKHKPRPNSKFID